MAIVVNSVIEELEQGRVRKYTMTEGEFVMSFAAVIYNLKTSIDFRAYFIELLKNCPFEAYFWEVKPITSNNLEDDFEFVLVDTTSFSTRKADQSSFQKYFSTDKYVVSFPNLRGDAQLVVPASLGEENTYLHLANFVRQAPEKQVDAFWQLVGKTFEQKIGEQPKWLSTAGLGVSWLHVRIDSTPKYYRYHHYKVAE
jgi:hypothetical protein